MRLAPFSSWTRWEKVALCVWAALLLFVCVRVFARPTVRTVYPIFSGSAQLWWQGDDLYEPDRPKTVQDGYRYSPTFAILMSPFALFPDEFGGVLWRLVSSAALLGALAWFARSVLPTPLNRDQFAWLTLLCVPLAVQSINNGQANVIVIAAMLGTVAAVKEERWSLASALMALAFVSKVYPLALGMILVLLHPKQLSWRMGLALAVGLALPFALQEPHYVADQYAKWIALLRADDRTHTDPDIMHRDLWLLIDQYGIPISRRFYTLLQIACGAGVAALCWMRQRSGWPTPALLTGTLALAVAWMMVLGPVVESSTFMLLAPSLALSILSLLQRGMRSRCDLLLVASAGLFVTAALLGGIANTARLNISGIHPLASLLYFVFLICERRESKIETQVKDVMPLAA